MRYALTAFVLACLLMACGNWKTDPATLTARTGPATGMGCMNCHAYPPQDSNHLYHLYQASADKFVNGAITCLACHRNSLIATEVALADTFFRNPDPLGDIPYVSSMNAPVSTPADTFEIRVRTWPIDSVVVRHQTHPVPQPGGPASAGDIAYFMTGLAHMNGTMDVVFDPKHSNPARFGGASASYNAKEETCSAVDCHPGDDPYRFAAPSKGLPGLKE
jgi:hypothetical protein